MSEKIEVAIADDDEVFVYVVTRFLKLHKNISITVKANSGKELLDKLKKKDKKPDVILLDLVMPVMDGTSTLEFLSRHYPEIKVLILTFYQEPGISQKLIERGANGFILKNTDLNKLAEIIEIVHAQHYYFVGWNIKEIMVAKVETKSVTKKLETNFTKREMEIIRFICAQQTNKEIAVKLGISIKTVGTHRDRILQKTDARNTGK